VGAFDGIADATRLAEAESLLRDHGGRITTDIHDPKLTHIIMDDQDSARYAEISRNTAKCVNGEITAYDRPKRKHIVLPSWVHECLDEETLMNEDGECCANGPRLTYRAQTKMIFALRAQDLCGRCTE
jgi:DNA ligase-4